MSAPHSDELLDRYLAGESLPEPEAAEIRASLDATPWRRGVMAGVRAAARGDDLAARQPTVDHAHQLLMARLDAEPVQGSRSTRPPRATWGRWMLVGGALACSVGIGTVTWRTGHSNARPAVSAAAPTVYRTGAGQVTQVRLPEGSHATLGPATTLAVTSDATGSIVDLSGQAMFTVTHAPSRPFIVRTRGSATRVLGTTFVVRRYATDPMAQVVVVEGRVSFGRGRDSRAGIPAVLASRMMGQVDDSGHVRVVVGIAANDSTAWTRGELVFRQTSAREIVAELSRAYEADIRLTDSVLARRAFTWTVPITRLSLSGALQALTAVLGAHVVQADGVVTIVPGPTPSPRTRAPLSPSSVEPNYGR